MLEAAGNSLRAGALLQPVRAVPLGDLAEPALHGAGHAPGRRFRRQTADEAARVPGETLVHRLRRDVRRVAGEAPCPLRLSPWYRSRTRGRAYMPVIAWTAWRGLGRPVFAPMPVAPSLRRAARSGFPARAALLPRRVQRFWAPVRTEYPCFSQSSRRSFSRAVWSMSQPAWPKPEGALAQDEPSGWALNLAAHSHEDSPERSRGSQVTQLQGPVARSWAIV